MRITKEMAREFWRDLMETLWHDPDTKVTHGIMSAELIADHMEMPVEKVREYLRVCVGWNITERQGGGYVV